MNNSVKWLKILMWVVVAYNIVYIILDWYVGSIAFNSFVIAMLLINRLIEGYRREEMEGLL